MDGDIARWRIAYDTLSALIDADQSAARQPSRPSVTAASAAVSSHRDNAGMIQQQQQQGGVADVQLTRSSLLTVQSNQPQVSNLPATMSSVADSNHLEHATTMRSVAGCGVRGDGESLVALFRRLLDTFYMETVLWMYNSILLSPAARRTRNRLRWLGVVTGRSLEQATSNVLTGFIAGYRYSRRAVNSDIEEALLTSANDQARRLAQLAVQLGLILNARLLMRSFSSVVRDLVFRTSSLRAAPAASRLYR